MPKSSSLGAPSRVTRMFDGLRSRWTIRFWCARCTAEQTVRNSRSRCSTLRRARIAIDVDRLAVDVLHDDVRRAVRGRAAVEQPRDVRMVERREDLALELQPALDVARQQPAPHQLDRDLLLELLVGALREEHLAHAAAAEAAHDAIRTDALAGEIDCRVARRSPVPRRRLRRTTAGAIRARASHWRTDRCRQRMPRE